MIKLSASVEEKVLYTAKLVGKTPATVIKNALDVYLEELEDAIDVKARKGNKSISLNELGKRLGL